MIERKVVLKNRTGLHARPASELVAFAKELPCKVYLEHNGKKAAADSILQLLALGAFCRWRRGQAFCGKTGSLSGDSGGISLEG